MVGCNECFVGLELTFQVGHRGALKQGSVVVVAEGNVVAVLHRVALVGGEGEEFLGHVGLTQSLNVGLPATRAESAEGTLVVVDNPLQARVALTGNVGPQGVGSDGHEVQLLLGSSDCIAQVAVTVGYIAVVVDVAPPNLHLAKPLEHLFQLGRHSLNILTALALRVATCNAKHRARCSQTQYGPARFLQKVSPIHIVYSCSNRVYLVENCCVTLALEILIYAE